MSRILKSYLANEPAIKRFLSRYRRNPQDIDDMAQETFLRVFNADLKREIHAPKAFLFRTAKNIALNDLTNKTNQIVDYVGDSADTDVLGSEKQDIPDDQLDIRQRFEILKKALATLPPKCRRVFLLRKVDGYTHKEIAARLEISTKTVENHLTNGAIKCTEYLRSEGFDPVEFVSSMPNRQECGEEADAKDQQDDRRA